ncbi:hypothetical protein N0G65_000400 [Providencia rettgeri]|nr:hypothetical protein [Providencia rettgeri]
MNNDKTEVKNIVSGYDGLCTFENYWGEELISVRLEHYTSGMLNKTKYFMSTMELENIADRTELKKVFAIRTSIGELDRYDYWAVTLHTKSGRLFRTKDRFRCSYTFHDSFDAVLGVNGVARTLYIAFSSSLGCSTELIEVL